MTRTELTNDGWGLDTNCFVCEERNQAGLGLQIFVDDETQRVESDFTLGHQFSGSPTVVHGGISLAVLDEVQAWAVIALAGGWGVTTETAAKFSRAVWVDAPHRALAEITGRDGDQVTTRGWIVDAKDRTCVESTATFTVVGEAVAKKITGKDLSDDNRKFTSGS